MKKLPVGFIFRSALINLKEQYKKFVFITKMAMNRNIIKLSTYIKGSENIKLGIRNFIGKFVTFHSHSSAKMTIGDNCRFENFSVLEALKGSIIFGSNSTLNQFCIIRAYGDVNIGSGVRIGPSTQIMAMKHNFDNPDKYIFEQGLSGKGITINDNVWIGGNVYILDGVTIGKNCVIGASSVVTKDIPENSIAVGNPAKVIKELKSNI